MAKLLLVDDDKRYIEILGTYLRDLGNVVDICFSGEEALQILQSKKYELVILDWTMPGMSGYEVCTSFRNSGGQTPIIFLTGLSDVGFLELGLEGGADDYITKPFDMRELNARIKSILKRRVGNIIPKLTVQNLTLVVDRQIIYIEGNEKNFVRLRPKESSLLEFLFKNPNRTHSAKSLLENCWPSESEAGPNSVRTWMGNLRNKLEQVGKGELIQTVVGSGYFVSDDAE